MVKLADTPRLERGGEIHVGSNPTIRTNFKLGSWYNGITLDLQSCDRGSIPRDSTKLFGG